METSSARHLDNAAEKAAVRALPIDPELVELRNALRNRHSVDHFASAWYTALGAVLLCGLWIKLFHDRHGPAVYLWPGALLCVSVIALAGSHLRQGLRLLKREREQLRRLRVLEANTPPRPELF
jgi:hypothetical protein